MSEVNIWDRQSTEPEEAFAAFWRWRDATPRPRLIDLATLIGRPYAIVMRWHREHMWEARALAWDQRVDARRQEVVLESLDEMHRRHIALAQQAQRITQKALNDIESRIESMTPRDATRMGDVFIKLERLARGEVTERVAGADYGKLSDADLKILEELAKKSK